MDLMAAWLGQLPADAGSFDWDSGNRAKSRTHGVEAEDIEAMLSHDMVLAGRIVDPPHEASRWLILGLDVKGRRLALIATRRGDRLRPISCRPMRRSERAVHAEAIGRR